MRTDRLLASGHLPLTRGCALRIGLGMRTALALTILTFSCASLRIGPLRAAPNLVPNPFTPVQGSYVGLFSDADGASFGNSGWLTARVTSGGRFSSKVQVAGKAYGFSGQFTTAGEFTASL